MQEFIASNREAIAELCRTHHVKRLAVFGSAARDDFDPARSDIDLLVEFVPLSSESYSQNFFSLEQEMARLFGRDVDLIVASSLKNPFIIRRMREHQEQLYAA
jgi:predicted nucleotidyltransferase